MTNPDWAETLMEARLQQRQKRGTLRRLPVSGSEARNAVDAVDFASNDYLGLAQSKEQSQRVEQLFREAAANQTSSLLGATGSRLLSGDSSAFSQLEQYLAHVHGQPAALLCNSGYDANLSLVSSLACDVILYDDLAHNSLHMGLRLWQSRAGQQEARPFAHNSAAALTRQLQQSQVTGKKKVVILVESVYSMDGDCAPLQEILDLAHTWDARVVVDEAHSLGVCGPTGLLASLGLAHHPALLAVVYTFGKAAGCHGAVITGSQALKSYLINFGYTFIYSTALPLHSLCTIQASYETMTSARGDELRAHLKDLITFFQIRMRASLARLPDTDISLIPSSTAIQALVVPGNQRCSAFCESIWRTSQRRIRLFPIKSPTVPVSRERVRIVLHAHNTRAQVHWLVDLLVESICHQLPATHVQSKL